MRNRFGLGLQLVGFVLAWATPGSAAQEYFVSSSLTAGSTPPLYRGLVRDSVPKFENYVEVLDPIYFQTAPNVIVTGSNLAGGGARANRGVLGARSRVTQTAQGGLSPDNSYGAVTRSENIAEFSFDDISIRPRVGPPPPFVAATFRFALDGLLADPISQGQLYDTALITNFPNELFADLQLRIQLDVSLRSASGLYASAGGGDITLQSDTSFIGNSNVFGPSGSGSLAGLVTALQSGATVIVLVPFLGVPVDEPLTLTVRLLTSASTGFSFYEDGGSWQSIAEVDYMATSTFALDFVATLPDDMTLDSVSAGIVDNVWTPLPEPTMSPMVTIGILVLLARRRALRKQRIVAGLTPLFLLLMSVGVQAASPTDREASSDLSERYARLGLAFEPNVGQLDAAVQYVSRGPGYTVFLAGEEAVIVLSGAAEPRDRSVLRLELVGARPAQRVTASEPLSGVANYLIGDDPTQWHTRIPLYGKVRYEAVYPGVDLVYYGNGSRLEFDFVVVPGVDPDVVQLSFEGISQVRLDEEGDLVIGLGNSSLTLRRPAVYQEIDHERRTIPGRYRLLEAAIVAFEIGDYDESRPLVIDPVLDYSTYLGSSGFDEVQGMAVMGDGTVIVAGVAGSTNFPTTVGAFQEMSGGGSDAFVARINPAGSALEYSTYLGGSSSDSALGLAVDASENVYLVGSTRSTNFPTSVGAFQTTKGGAAASFDAFVAKLNSDGSGLIYASYLGGGGDERGQEVAVSGTGEAVVVGQTQSPTDFPISSGAVQEDFSGSSTKPDAFVTKFTANGNGLVYSTFLGGTDDDRAWGVALDSNGNAYVTGVTESSDFPTKSAAQDTFAGGPCLTPPCGDAFVAALNSMGTAFVYSTFWGGSGADAGNSIAVSRSGTSYVLGYTGSSTDFPVTAGVFQPDYGGGLFDHFVASFDSSGASSFSTYLGGDGHESQLGVGDITLDGSGRILVAGGTASSDFPVVNPVQEIWDGVSFDAYLAQIHASGSTILFSTYLGGSNADHANGVGSDVAGNLYLAGMTQSDRDFPIVNAIQDTAGDATDGFVAKISNVPEPGRNLSLMVALATLLFARRRRAGPEPGAA